MSRMSCVDEHSSGFRRVHTHSVATFLPSFRGTEMLCLFSSKVSSPTPARRRRYLLTCSIAAIGALFATNAMAIDVANQTDWNTAVAAVAAAGAGSTVTINITSGFTLTSSLAALQAG